MRAFYHSRVDYNRTGYRPYVESLRMHRQWGWLAVFYLTGLVAFSPLSCVRHPVRTLGYMRHGFMRRARWWLGAQS